MSNKTIFQKIEKKAKQRIYKWHRFFAYIAFIPVILWCLSGIMHPFMAHFFKPEIKNEFFEPKTIAFNKMKVSLQEVLKNEKITTFKNFRYVEMDNRWYYQVKLVDNSLVYFNTFNGKKLVNGDQLYACHLARFFLDDQQSKIIKTDYLTQFDNQYKYVNRYLPVYKITFGRSDNMQVYVETTSSKLATFNPTSRQVFIWFFDTFHNWSFLDAITNNEVRIVLMSILLGFIILSALSGLFMYGFFWKVFKKTAVNVENKTRIQHRKLGLWFSIFSIGFASSGAFHLIKKWDPKPVQEMVYQPDLEVKNVKKNVDEILVDKAKLQNVSLIQFQDSVYYRCELKPTSTQAEIDAIGNKWKKKSAPIAYVVYVNAQTNTIVKDLDFKYAEFLAHYIDGDSANGAACCDMESNSENTCSIAKAHLKETKVLNEFDNREYGFVNKRLPVVKLAYDTPENTTYFVETSTSRIASVVGKSDRIEGYSFAFFHKFLWMDWAGKPIRDLVMTVSAIVLFTLALLGLRLLLKK